MMNSVFPDKLKSGFVTFVDFEHPPIFTFPIGGTALITADKTGKATLVIEKH